MDLQKVKKCVVCRRLFEYPGYGPQMCPMCKIEDEAQFKRVKDYLRDNPGKTLMETSKDCDVTVDRIRFWLKDERLVYADIKDTGLVCENCGTPITTGTLCEECRQSFIKTAGEMKRSMDVPKISDTVVKKNTGDRMRFLNHR